MLNHSSARNLDPSSGPKCSISVAAPAPLPRAASVMVFLVLGILYLACSPGEVLAEEARFQWGTRVTLSETYDDNIDLDKNHKKSDWITTVGPGVTLSVETEKTKAQLDYDVYYSFYARHPDDNSLSHALSLTGFKGIPVAEHFTLDLDENLTISEDPIQANTTSVQRSRETYYSNTAGGRLNYLFGPQDSLYVGFKHTYYDSTDSSVQGGYGYGPTAGMSYWFTVRQGISLDFSLWNGRFDHTEDTEGSDDFDEYRGSATYTYRFDPRTTANLSYTYDRFDYQNPGPGVVQLSGNGQNSENVNRQDYVVHSGSLGLSHDFTEHFSASISGGWWYQVREDGSNAQGPNGSVSLTQKLEKGSLNLSAATGYNQQFFQAENLGLSQYSRVTASLSYQLRERLTGTLAAFYDREKYKETVPTRTDDTWGASAGLSYLVYTWLSAGLDYSYRQMDSTLANEEYTDNRVTFTLTAFYLSTPKSF